MNLPDKVTGNTYTPAEFTEFKNEIMNLLTSAGITPASGSLQNKQAIARYASGGDFYIDSGAANAYVLSTIGSQDRPDALINGASAVFEAGNTNTGASTAAVNGTGAKSIKKNGYANNVEAGDIVAGKLYSLRYSSGDDAWELGSVGLQDFRASKATNGYTYLPNGLILNWGRTSSVATQVSATATFSKPFPNACLNVTATNTNPTGGTGGDADTWAQVESFTKTQVTIRFQNANTSSFLSTKAYYLAIGY